MIGAAASPAPPRLRPSLTVLLTERVRIIGLIALARQHADRDAREMLGASLDDIDDQLAGPAGAALRRICDLFQLSVIERDVLTACLAQAIDPTLANLFAQLYGSAGRSYMTEPLIAQLFDHPAGHIWNPAGALALWGLVQAQPGGTGEPSALLIDAVVPAWLDGALWIDRSLAGLIRKAECPLCLASWPVEAMSAAARHALETARAIQFIVSGEAGSGRAALAAAVAERADLDALMVDTTDIGDAEWVDNYVRLQRLAAVSGTALIWTGTQVGRPWPGLVAPAPVHFLAVEPGEIPRVPSGVLVHRVVMPELTIEERSRLWRELVPGARLWPAQELDALGARYRLGAGDIAAIAADPPQGPRLAAFAARNCHGQASDDVVQSLECPYDWDDLVLPDALRVVLADFAFELCDRERVWEEHAAGWLFPREPALVALFCGPSGTGKTMAAQVIAAQLQLDLLRVDLAAVVSKYIGETAKNLRRVFALGRRRQAILLFDEADAYFARRTEIKDAHDRYANADTNYLLQLIERHRGVVILATNRRSDMDPAFVRRLRHVFEFPRPSTTERLQLWDKALAAVAPQPSPTFARRLAELAETVDVSGAQIKNAALSALFIARRSGMPLQFSHLLQGLDRELAKEGRPLASKVRERWLSHA
jgi:AAA+ superfamily predicted ATPase